MKNSAVLKEELRQGKHSALFQDIYLDESLLEYQNRRYAEAVAKFEELFGEKEVEIYSAPGRSEVGGNHTDHQLGSCQQNRRKSYSCGIRRIRHGGSGY